MVEKWLPKTPDLEEVIRCRDCKFSANDGCAVFSGELRSRLEALGVSVDG